MANVQVENGYTRIANELLEVIYSANFNATQLKIILCIIRYTYGFKRKSHNISVGFLSRGTGISKRYISIELKKLIDSNVVKLMQKHTDTTSRVLMINKDYFQWQGYGTILHQVNNTSSGEEPISTTDEQLFTTPDEQLFTQERNIKENIKERRKSVFDYYLTLDLVRHQKYTSAMDEAINSAMKNYGYSIEDCMVLLDRHKRTVQETKNNLYPVKTRPLHAFFGQKAYQSKHLICVEYEEGGKYYTEDIPKENLQPRQLKPVFLDMNREG